MPAKIRYSGNDPGITADSAISSKASKGTVGSRTFDQSTSAKKPTHKDMGSNAKLFGGITTTSFDGGDYLDLSTAEEFAVSEAWLWVFAFVDLDTTTDCILAYSSNNGGYIGIEAGGNGIVYRSNSSRASETTIATNNTDNSSISYSFGTDVEVLIVSTAAGSNLINFYNIDGALIATNGSASGACTTWNLDRIGANSSTSTEFVGELIDVRLYNGSEVASFSDSQFQAIGNRYKQYKN
tara:strand:- start:193 stop:909 length:717 start_codon:yes stop_codon:yes gene_type:complete